MVRRKGSNVPIHLKRPPGAFQELLTGPAAQHGLSHPNSLKDFNYLSTPVDHTHSTLPHPGPFLNPVQTSFSPPEPSTGLCDQALLPEANTIPTGA